MSELKYKTEGWAEVKGEDGADTAAFAWVKGAHTADLRQSQRNAVTLSKKQLLKVAELATKIAEDLV